jgi:PHP family Zn ribbon phosphoesterase
MTIDINDDKKEPDIIYNAIQLDEQKPDDSRPAGAVAGPPIPQGHERFYCSQCNAHYDLPNRATSWRCQNCHHFNSITPGECEWCTIL